MNNKIYLLLLVFWNVALAQETETKSFTLKEATEYALQNNFNVRNAGLDIDIAQQQVRETIAQGLPQINGNLGYDYYIKQPVSILPDFITPSVINTNQNLGLITQDEAQDALNTLVGPPQAVIFGTKQNFSAGVQWDQLLFSGSYLVGLQSAKAFKKISELGKEKTETQIKEAIVNAYSAVLVAGETVKIIQKNVEVVNRNLFETNEIFKAGFTEQQSVDQLNYSKKQLDYSLNYAKRQKDIAEKTLKYIMGLDQEVDITLMTTIEDIIGEDLNLLKDIELEELKRHIDYRLADNTLTTSELQIKYQKTFALPTLSGFFSYSYNENGNDFLLFQDNKTSFRTSLAGIRMNIPIFSGLARTSRTQQAKLNYEKAMVDMESTKQNLIKNAKQAQLEYENALENYQTNQELVSLSQNIYDKEQVKYFEGISTSTELTTVENQLYQSEAQLIQSVLQVVSAKANLKQALGLY